MAQGDAQWSGSPQGIVAACPPDDGHPIPDLTFGPPILSLKSEQLQISLKESKQTARDALEGGLQSIVAEYEASLAEVADLVAHVRHEINNPLTGVIGQAQLLLREELTETARRRVETIEQLATRIRDTVAQLRQIQRPIPNSSLTIRTGAEPETQG
jgi:signal transduction histidine kinase